jgi:DNA polymerase-3 subunit alpha
MAALLTSEMANTDKVVVHMDECRTMGIGILPPDVNVSRFSFTVDGDTIRFGLGAIKNLGQKAIESIVGSREQRGAFASLFDFCRRLDLQLVNRRVVESLVKAGAFDFAARPRAQLMAALDGAFEAGQRHQRERDQGQVSMFDLLGGAGEGAAVDPDPLDASIAEWDAEQRLLNEKEVLGFYLSGHPLRGVWDRAQQLGVVGTGELGQTEDGARVLLCGLVSALREINTKNGNRMGFATIEDVEGTIEVTIFPELFRQSAAHLRSGGPLLVRGKVEGSTTARKLLADDVRPLPADDERTGVSPLPRSCRVSIRTDGGPDPLPALRAICEAHRGTVPLALRLRVDGAEVDVRSRTLRVRPSAAFVEAVEGLLGPGSVTLEG